LISELSRSEEQKKYYVEGKKGLKIERTKTEGGEERERSKSQRGNGQ